MAESNLPDQKGSDGFTTTTTYISLSETNDENQEAQLKAVLAQNNTLCEILNSLSSKKSGNSPALQRAIELLQDIHDQLDVQTTTPQFIWNAVLQTVLVCTAFLFGLFGIFSWHGQYDTNVIALRANQIALIQFCLGNNATLASDPCAVVIASTPETLKYLATRMFSPQAMTDMMNSDWPSTSMKDPTIRIVYISVPLLSVLLGGIASWRIYLHRGRLMAKKNP